MRRVGSGHYTAYGIHEGRWYHFNDSTVTLTNEDAVRKAKAYILFYVEKTEQVAPDGNRTGGKAPAAADAAAGDGATDVVLVDVAPSRVNTLDKVAGERAALGKEGGARAAADGETSGEAAAQ